MGDSLRNCKRIAETTESKTTCVTKKLKICFDFEELQVPVSNFELLKDCAVVDSSERPSNSGGAVDDDPCSSSCSCFSQTSRCSNSKIMEECSRFVDREAKSFETEDSTCITGSLSTPPFSDFFDSPVAEKKPVGDEMPSQGEIEAFFGTYEKFEQKRFIEKYNFDVVNGVPLEGRYHWVRLK